MQKNNMKTVICVPSYGFRFTELFLALEKIKNQYDIRIFVSNNDPEINKYYSLGKDLGITIIPTDANNIMEKRHFMFEWTKQNNYDYAFIIEDDIKAEGKKITPESKRETSESYRGIKISVSEIIEKLLNSMQEHDAAFGSIIRQEYLGFSKPGKININRTLNCGQFICYNVQKIKENNIEIYVGELIPEDVKFVFDILTCGLTCICLCDYTYVEQSLRGKSVVHNDIADRSFAHIRLSRMYNFPMKISKDGTIRPKMDFKKYYNVGKNYPEYKKDEKPKYDCLYEMYDNGCSYEEILKYLQEEILNKH